MLQNGFTRRAEMLHSENSPTSKFVFVAGVRDRLHAFNSSMRMKNDEQEFLSARQ